MMYNMINLKIRCHSVTIHTYLNTHEDYKANLRIFMSKYDEIKNQHRGEFIAILNGDIIGDTDHEALLEKIRQKVEDKDADSVFQTYISKTDDIVWR
jgi:RNA binding exosome subunit